MANLTLAALTRRRCRDRLFKGLGFHRRRLDRALFAGSIDTSARYGCPNPIYRSPPVASVPALAQEARDDLSLSLPEAVDSRLRERVYTRDSAAAVALDTAPRRRTR